MEKITFSLAVISFVMSSVTWFREFWMRRNRIKINILDYSWPLKTTQFLMLIQNKSTLPASISKISVQFGEKWFDCELEPKKIKTILPETLITSPHFPISITPLSFHSIYLEFVDVPDMQLNPGKTIVFQVHTSRGTLKKSVTLGNKGHYLHRTH